MSAIITMVWGSSCHMCDMFVVCHASNVGSPPCLPSSLWCGDQAVTCVTCLLYVMPVMLDLLHVCLHNYGVGIKLLYE